MRALRDLPAAVPDLPRARRGDGLAPRPRLPDARGRRGTDRAHADHCAPPRSLPRLPRVRDGVSRPACRSASCSRPRAASSSDAGCRTAARLGDRCASSLEVFPHPGSARPPCSHALAHVPALGHAGAGARRSACWRRSRSSRDGGAAAARCPRRRAAARAGPGARRAARARSGVLRAASQRFFYPDVNARHRAAPRGGRLRRGGAARAGVLRGAPPARRAHRRVPRDGAPADGGLRPDVDVIVVNAAGCGSALKEYGHWLPDDAARPSPQRVRDVSEVLAGRRPAARRAAA